MRRVLLLTLIVAGFFTVCSAAYNAPILKTALHFQAKSIDGKVITSWANIDIITTGTLQGYRVVKSSINHFPVYPEDENIATIADRKQTSFVETKPSYGTYYYRVCAIMQNMDRYCSNVISLTIVKNGNNSSEQNTSSDISTKILTPLTTNFKTTIEGFITTFMKNLDTTYGNNIAKKIIIVDALITRITSNATGKSTALFTYLKEKLEEQSDILRLQILME